MFDRIEVPTPFQVGSVNAYLAGRTLVDPGPDSETAWDHLTDALADRGLAGDDVARVLVTHPHPDHFGLAGRLRDRGAEVCASPAAADIVGDFAGRLAFEQSYFEPLLRRHGLDPQTATTAVELAEAFVEFAPPVETDRRLAESDEVTVDGRSVRVLSADGHAPGELVFAFPDDDGESAVVGDQVLADITPNPLLQPPAEEGDERPSMVSRLNASLERLRAEGFERLLPGHRGRIDAPATRIGEILSAHEERSDRVADIVSEPTTAAEVSRELFGDLPATEVFPAMSEAVGHLDLLEERGVVRSVADADTVRYERVET